jgi:multicomponent Na+:H+ antiporter subunit F
MMFVVAAAAVLIALMLAVARALAGPTVFDRLVAANKIGNACILLLAVFGFLTGRPHFLDMAILFGLLNIIAVFAVLKFLRYGDLGRSGGEEPTT